MIVSYSAVVDLHSSLLVGRYQIKYFKYDLMYPGTQYNVMAVADEFAVTLYGAIGTTPSIISSESTAREKKHH